MPSMYAGLRTGEAVELVDCAGLRVLAVDREPAPEPRIVVVQGLPKGELLTEAGVHESCSSPLRIRCPTTFPTLVTLWWWSPEGRDPGDGADGFRAAVAQLRWR